jgi:hypothetical protein
MCGRNLPLLGLAEESTASFMILISVCDYAYRYRMNKFTILVPSVLRGSLIRLRRKCGKPNCHCAQGQLHAAPVLSYSQKGRTKLLTLPSAHLPKIRAALKRYRQGVLHLERQADAGLQKLTRQLRRARSSR